VETERNAFEALCEIAARERWCWNIMCTTCGHMDFRYSFLELALGSHPERAGWITRAKNHRQLQTRLGALPRSLGTDEIERLGSILVGASLRRIARSCPFPDWLGYLGLALFYTRGSEQVARRITNAWVPQLQELVQPGTPADTMLRGKLTVDGFPLGWQDLELVESAYRRAIG
jgi:hypothetical protein